MLDGEHLNVLDDARARGGGPGLIRWGLSAAKTISGRLRSGARQRVAVPTCDNTRGTAEAG
jgi:hypothetical protein